MIPILILLLLTSLTNVLAVDAVASKGFGISMQLIVAEILSSDDVLNQAIPDDVPDEATYTVTAKDLRVLYAKMKLANWYYDNYIIARDELEAYKRNWPKLLAASNEGIELAKSLQGTVLIWQLVELGTVITGTILYLSK